MVERYNFKRVNPHPQCLIVGDCVKRACVLASGINYHDIAIMLNRFRKETGAKKFNTNDNWRQFIIKVLKGYDCGNMQYAYHGHRYKVYEFAGYCHNKAIVQCSKHLVAIDGEGNYLDSWDSGDKSIYKAYTLPVYEKIVEHIKKNYPKLCKGLTLERYRIRIPI